MELPELLIECLNKIATKRSKTDIKDQAKEMLKQLQSGEKVCRLKKALYDLKQAGRQWHKKLNEKLQELKIY